MIKFHSCFRNGAVLQRGTAFVVKGYSEGETKVTLSGDNYKKTVITVAKKGVFRAEFPPVNDIATHFLLSAECGGEKVCSKVRFGDVFLTVGQSNMSYSLSATENCERWLIMAKKSETAFLSVGEKPFNSTEEITRSYDELFDFPVETAWIKGDDEEIAGVSAISVQLAVYLWQRTGVPIGIVNASMGGLSVESYLRRKTAEGNEELLGRLKAEGRYVGHDKWNRSGIRNFTQLSSVWNEKIAPLDGFSVKGIVWYLGESSAWDYEAAVTFRIALKAIVGDMRELFGDVPFVTTEIAPEYYPYGDGFGYLYVNEALADFAKEAKMVYHIPIYDIEPRWLKYDGDEYYHPIHPVNKQPISERICEVFRGTVTKYPSISRLTQKNGRLILTVDNVETQLLKIQPNGFTVAGKTGKYFPAQAKIISDNEIELFCEDVPFPTRATYAFLQYRDFCNARTIDGVPLLPYRSERGAVTKDYCFTPAFITRGADEVYENNFGYEVGFCRKIPVWTSGKIYRCAAAGIDVRGNGDIVVSATPGIDDYKFFGVSPEICLCGHKNHLADYDYLRFTVIADVDCEFRGIIFKLADGSIYRYDLLSGREKIPFFAVTKEKMLLRCDLKCVTRGDGSPLELTGEERRKVVQIEFLFRARKSVKVTLGDLAFTDLAGTDEERKISGNNGKEGAKPARADVCLPT